MYTQETFFQILTKVCDELPSEFFNELHLGIIMSPETKFSPYAVANDLVVLGEYHRSHYGNQIIIYYGSFQFTFPHLNEVELEGKLREVVRHEFRHHMEFRAGIHGKDSLEYEDLLKAKNYLQRFTANKEKISHKQGVSLTSFLSSNRM